MQHHLQDAESVDDMTNAQSDLSKLGAKLSPPPLPFGEGEVSVVRLRPADVARLLGCSRARVSQLVKQGKISAFADGSIDPSRCASELIRSDPKGARSKILTSIRSELDEAQGQAVEALMLRDAMARERDRLAAELADVREVLRSIAHAWLTAEYWLNTLDATTRAQAATAAQTATDLEAAFDQAGAAALAAALPELLAGGPDPDLIASLAAVDPAGPWL
jgi:hypothetical protein